MFKGLPLFYEKGQAGETPHSAEFLFLFLKETIHCDPSLEQSQQDGSKEGSHCMFLSLSNKENYPEIIPVTPSYLDHCDICRCIYSRTSMARTLMARLPRLFRTHS